MRTEITAPQISSPTMNCSPSIARIRFSQHRDARPFFSRMIHLPPSLFASSCCTAKSLTTGHRISSLVIQLNPFTAAAVGFCPQLHSVFVVIKPEDRKIFARLTTPPALSNIFVTQCWRRDLFAVVNLLVLRWIRWMKWISETDFFSRLAFPPIWGCLHFVRWDPQKAHIRSLYFLSVSRHGGFAGKLPDGCAWDTGNSAVLGCGSICPR